MPVDPLPTWMDASPEAMDARRRVRYRAATLDEYVAQAEMGYLAAVGRSVAL